MHLADAMPVLPCRDADIRVDRCRFITLDRLREIANEEAAKANIYIKKCERLHRIRTGVCRLWIMWSVRPGLMWRTETTP